MNVVLIVLALLFVVATVLPLLRNEAWWIRVFDFPRLQIAGGGVVVTALYALFRDSGGTLWGDALLGLLVLCVLYQLYCIYPYTPLAVRQVVAALPGGGDPAISLLIANVLMDNREAAAFLRLVRDADPDVILTVETDGWWEEHLRPLEHDYPWTVKEPLSNTYGMLLYSRLQLIDPQVKYLVEDDVPSIHAGVRLRSGQQIRLHCLHPKPPAPQESTDTTERDAELLIVGKRVAERDGPAIVAGDMNDVAWSYTTSLFQKISGLLDPRRGRGMYNTFSAKNPLLRWPLDHVFHSHHFELAKLERLPAFGSDHFPVYVALALAADAQSKQEEPEMDEYDAENAREKVGKVQQKEPVP